MNVESKKRNEFDNVNKIMKNKKGMDVAMKKGKT